MEKTNQLRRIIRLNQELLRKELRSPFCDRERVERMIVRYKRWIVLESQYQRCLDWNYFISGSLSFLNLERIPLWNNPHYFENIIKSKDKNERENFIQN